MRIAWFLSCKKKDYASSVWHCFENITLVLKDRLDVEIIDSSVIADKNNKELSSFVLQLQKEHAYDFFVYEIDDSLSANDIRRCLALVPGVVLFHDILFRPQDVNVELEALFNLTEPILSSLTYKTSDSKSAPHGFLSFESSRSFISFFFSLRNLSEFKRFRCRQWIDKQIDVFYLPYPLADSAENLLMDTQETRGEVKIAFCGGLGLEYRAQVLLKALCKCAAPTHLTWLLNVEEQEQAKEILSDYGILNYHLCSPKTFSNWQLIVQSSDMAVHTLFSVYGDAGIWLYLSMQAGLECAVNDFSGSSIIPEALVYKLPLGVQECESLSGLIEAIWNGHKMKGESAKKYAQEFHRADIVAKEFMLVLEKNFEFLSSKTKVWFEKHQTSRFVGK